MNRSILVGLALVVALGGCAHQRPASTPDFAQLEQRWMDALAEKRVAELEQLVASDFTIVGAGSTADDPVGDRATWLSNAVRFPWPRHEVRNVRARILGDAAVVHALLLADYPPHSITPEGGRLTFVVTDVWVWRDGRWQVTSRHSNLSR